MRVTLSLLLTGIGLSIHSSHTVVLLLLVGALSAYETRDARACVLDAHTTRAHSTPSCDEQRTNVVVSGFGAKRDIGALGARD